MKLIANENFQFQGIHRTGATLTVSADILKKEVDKGKHPTTDRYMSGLIQHCTPANQETADFLESITNEPFEPEKDSSDEKDDSDEIREIRAEFDLMGKAYHPKWQLKRLRKEIAIARKTTGEIKEDAEEKETIIKG